MFQLIIRKSHEQTLAEFFSRGTVLFVDALPYRLSGKVGAEVDAVAPQLGETMLEFAATPQGGVAVTVTAPEEAQSPPREIRHGDSVEIGNAVVHVYFLRGRPKVSWHANALGRLAVAGVALALLLELAAFCAVPYLMNHSNHWRRQGELQAINYQTDALRKSLRKLVSNDPVTAAYLDALRGEMDERARFLRRYGESLSDAGRKEMLENLGRLEKIVDRLAESPQFLREPAELQVDEPVRKIIGTQ